MLDSRAKAELLAALKQLSPDEIQGALAQAQSRDRQKPTHKLGAAIDAIPSSDVSVIVLACREGLAGPEEDAIGPLMGVAPSLASQCLANSGYRQKPVKHSLRVVLARLEAHDRITEEPTPAAGDEKVEA